MPLSPRILYIVFPLLILPMLLSDINPPSLDLDLGLKPELELKL